jgi:nucleotide-binding universal stress UspA family protein
MRSILFPTDGSELSQKASKRCVEFAKALGARVVGVHVMPTWEMPMDEGYTLRTDPVLKGRAEEDRREQGEKALIPIRDEAAAAGVEFEGVVELNDRVYDGIIDTAERKECDLIVMASHGRAGVTGLLLGSETAKVLTHTKLPVLVLR